MKPNQKEIARLLGTSLAAGALIASGSATAATSIAGSKHDLSPTGTGQVLSTKTDEICVFCHTPHGSDTSAAVPLWNKGLPNPASYTTYDALGTTTLDGAIAPVGSVSIACLSCHDGSQSMDSVINAPGSGGYTAGGASLGQAMTMAGTPIPMLGQDLRDDHPVGVQYGGGGITAAAPAAVTNDVDFATTDVMTVNGLSIWWVEDGITAGRQKSEMALYTRVEAAAANTQEPFVECASCHDPHNASTLTNTPPSVAFLRQSNGGSAVCLACHTK